MTFIEWLAVIVRERT